MEILRKNLLHTAKPFWHCILPQNSFLNPKQQNTGRKIRENADYFFEIFFPVPYLIVSNFVNSKQDQAALQENEPKSFE